MATVADDAAQPKPPEDWGPASCADHKVAPVDISMDTSLPSIEPKKRLLLAITPPDQPLGWFVLGVHPRMTTRIISGTSILISVLLRLIHTQIHQYVKTI